MMPAIGATWLDSTAAEQRAPLPCRAASGIDRRRVQAASNAAFPAAARWHRPMASTLLARSPGSPSATTTIDGRSPKTRPRCLAERSIWMPRSPNRIGHRRSCRRKVPKGSRTSRNRTTATTTAANTAIQNATGRVRFMVHAYIKPAGGILRTRMTSGWIYSTWSGTEVILWHGSITLSVICTWVATGQLQY